MSENQNNLGIPDANESVLRAKKEAELRGDMLSIESRVGSLVTRLIQNLVTDLADNPQTQNMSPEEIASKVFEGLQKLPFTEEDIAARLQRLRTK